MTDPNLMAQLTVPSAPPTCVYEDEEGVLCGRPATHISCKPETDSPTCRAHKCGCARSIAGADEPASTTYSSQLNSDTVLSMLGGLKNPNPAVVERVRDEVGTLVQALREVSIELGRALERIQRLQEKLDEYEVQS